VSDAAQQNFAVKAELEAAYRRVMDAGLFVGGDEVARFEGEFAAFCGVRHCVAMGNGLDAITLLLRAHGIGAGDEVIVPGNTYIATWLGVTHTGAAPVPVEPDAATYNIDPALVENAITPKTRAIFAVHLYGQTADMGRLREIAARHGLLLFEDAAQAHGAGYKGAKAGNLGDGAAFSFYPTKNLGALGDGGAVTTNDDAVAEKLRHLRNYGSVEKNRHDIIGFNSRLDTLQAAFLQVKLAKLEAWNDTRRALAAVYMQHLPASILPRVSPDCIPVWHQFVIRTQARDRLAAHLQARGIATAIHYPTPPHLSTAYAGGNYPPLPVSETLAQEVLSLPMGMHLSVGDIERVCEVISPFFNF
jgi:dTDP-4-amino-4,6-dideoxygalactose transaminase